MKRVPEAERIKEDFEHGHKLGEKSTARLIDFLVTLAQDIDDLNCEMKRVRREISARAPGSGGSH